MKLVGERRALAAAILVFYFLFYALVAAQGLVPGFTMAFAAVAFVYGLAFFALVAGYFWARWYAVGVGLYGVITSLVGIWQIWNQPNNEDIIRVMLFVGGTHLAATVMLWGSAMSGPYDGKLEWRQKFHMDDSAVQRLGRAVIRAGLSLPFVLLYAFAPKPGGAELGISIAALVLTAFGLRGLVRLKTWGVLAIGAAGALMLVLAGGDLAAHQSILALRPALAGGLLLAATIPYVTPMVRWVAVR